MIPTGSEREGGLAVINALHMEAKLFELPASCRWKRRGSPVNWVEVEGRQLLVVGGGGGGAVTARRYCLGSVVAEQILKSFLHQPVGIRYPPDRGRL